MAGVADVAAFAFTTAEFCTFQFALYLVHQYTMMRNSHVRRREMMQKPSHSNHMEEFQLESCKTLAHAFDLDNCDAVSITSVDSILSLDSIFDVNDSHCANFVKSPEDPMQEKGDSFESEAATTGNLATARTVANQAIEAGGCSIGKPLRKRRRLKSEAPHCEHFGSYPHSICTYTIGHRLDLGWYVVAAE